MERMPEKKETKESVPKVEKYKLGGSVELDVVGNKGDSYQKQYEDMSKFTAELLVGAIEKGNLDENKKRIVLGLAADTSPEGMYREFANVAKKRNLDLSKIFVVRYEQMYGPGVKKGAEMDFDAFHEHYFFELNGIVSHPAEIKTDADGNEYVEGNFLPMYEEYANESDAENIRVRLEYNEEILKLVGKIDFAVMGLGKDGHIIDWGRGENRSSVRDTREKKPVDYDFNYKRFEGDEKFRNYMWDDIIKMGAELLDVPVEKVDESLKTSATLGIRHIIGASEIAIIAPQKTKAFAVKEAVLGSIDGDLIEEASGRVIKTIKRDRELRSPAGSVLRVRETLDKSSRLIITPEAAAELTLA